MKKKTATTKGKKKGNKKTTEEKADPLGQIYYDSLRSKKLKIMKEVPVFPCSVITKDRQGNMFAYTQADKIFRTYYEKAIAYKLDFAIVELQSEDATYSESYFDEGKLVIKEIPCTRVRLKVLVTDIESGQTASFWGSGKGDNGVWSETSANTIAFKQALIMWFLNSWPQPTDWCEVIRKELTNLKGEEFYKAIKKILPEKPPEPLTESAAIKELMEYFSGATKKSSKR